MRAINSFEKKHPWLSREIKKKIWSFIYSKENHKFIYHLNDLGFSLKLNSSDDSVCKQIFFGNYEKDTCRFVQKILLGGEVIFDIGANIGFYTILFSKLVGKSGQVHAFEPSLREFLNLCENVSINKSENIFLNQLAVSDQNGFASLSVMDDVRFGAFNSLASINHPRVREAKVHHEIIRVITIDDYCELFPANIPKLIKIDVEGLEKRVLMGAKLLLKSEQAPMIILEVFEDTLHGDGASSNDLTVFLGACGYMLFSIEEEGALTSYKKGSSLNCVALKETHFQQIPKLIMDEGVF